MDLEALTSLARQRTGDQHEPFRYTDDDWTGWANEAENEAAVRASLLYDDSSGFLTIPLQADVDTYALDARVWRIDRAWLLMTGQTRRRELDLAGPAAASKPGMWHECGPRSGRPERATHIGRALKVWPTPRDADVGNITLAVYRLPLEPMAAPSDEPEIDAVDHPMLVEWMLFRAWLSHDAETNDATSAATALSLFTARFGERPSADVIRRHNERRPVTAPYGGF